MKPVETLDLETCRRHCTWEAWCTGPVCTTEPCTWGLRSLHISMSSQPLPGNLGGAPCQPVRTKSIWSYRIIKGLSLALKHSHICFWNRSSSFINLKIRRDSLHHNQHLLHGMFWGQWGQIHIPVYVVSFTTQHHHSIQSLLHRLGLVVNTSSFLHFRPALLLKLFIHVLPQQHLKTVRYFIHHTFIRWHYNPRPLSNCITPELEFVTFEESTAYNYYQNHTASKTVWTCLFISG